MTVVAAEVAPALRIVASKAFGPHHALVQASLTAPRGQITALVGENGAGKSTLCHIAAGTVAATSGEIEVDGTRFEAPAYGLAQASAHGVALVAQHGSLIPRLSLAEHALMTPRAVPWRRRLGHAARRLVTSQLADLCEASGLACDPGVPCGALALGERQRAEIVLALWRGAKLLLLDEPTALLSPMETDALFVRLRALAATTSIVLVTHRLSEVAAVADSVTVLRRGQTVAAFAGEAVRDTQRIAHAMMGNALVAIAPPPPPSRRDVALVIDGLAVGPWHRHAASHGGLSLAMVRGEIVGIAGVEGNGQHELMAALAGTVPTQSVAQARTPTLALVTPAASPRDLTALSPRARRQAGLVVISGDRHRDGVIEAWSLPKNTMIGRDDLFVGHALPVAAAARETERIIAEANVTPSDAATLGALSGGNQQKFYMGRELGSPQLTAVVCAHPTRGVDLRAAMQIWRHLYALAAQGIAIAIISADVDELLAHCHRLVVLERGRLLDAPGATRRSLGELMTTGEEARAHA